MNVKPLLQHISPNTFITDYLKANGVQDVERYLEPDDSCFDNPWDYPGMLDAVELVHDHIKLKSKIGIVIDSDVDGACSSSIIYLFLKLFNITPSIFAHTGKQHGIDDLLPQILSSNLDLLIIPDAGTNCADECRTLKENNIDVLVLDHHEVEKDNPYAIVVNPHLGNGLNIALSGTGVTYQFIRAYCDKHKLPCPNYHDIVAVSLVSDICDLTSLENRAFINSGLNHPTNPFLQLLFEKKCKRRGITPEGISWDVAPLGNALARVDDQDTKLLFFDALAGNISYDKALTDISRVKRKQDEAVKAVVEDIEPTLDTSHKCIVGFTEAENKNYIGLIANKFTGKYKKLTVLLRELNSTTYSGSLRSPVDIAKVINESKLAKCQGHLSACGCTVKKSNLKKFIKFLETLDLSDNPDIDVAAQISPEDITLDLCKAYEDNKILWGKGLPNPQFYIKTKIAPSQVQVFTKSTTTIKISINNVDFMLFFAKDKDVEALTKNKIELEMVIELSTNTWNDVTSPQGIVKEYEAREIDDENINWEDMF